MARVYTFFSVTVHASTEHKYFAVSKDPQVAWERLQADAERDVPWTTFGRCLKDTLEEKADVEYRVENAGMKLTEALDMLQGVADAARFAGDAWYVQPDYSTWDDDFREPRADDSPQTTQQNTRLQPFDWASEEASAEFERLVLTHPDPTSLVFGTTMPDMMGNAFAEMCAKPRTWLAHGCVYNPRKKCVVIKVPGPEWCREVHGKEFATLTFPWLWQAIERVCTRVLSDPTFRDLQPHFHGVMRLLHVVDRSKAKQRADVSRRVLDVLRDAAKQSVCDTYEKMRRLYPVGHESAPDKMRYAKRISKEVGRTNSAPILDEALLKKPGRSKHKSPSDDD